MLRDPSNNPIVIPGLWSLSFGAGQPPPQASGPGNTLFFSTGEAMGNHGLFGTLVPTRGELVEGGDQ
jgi:hypothetical protein